MDDYKEKVNQAIDVEVEVFEENINRISEKGPFRKVRKIPTTFSMLKLGNDEFYEYAYFERTLEWFVRDLLVNPILCKLFSIHGIKLTEFDREKYVLYNTEDIENIIPLEFVFINGNKHIGVRYTSLLSSDVNDLRERYKIDKIIRINWNDEATNLEDNQENYEVVTPETFFRRYLSLDAYNLFFSKVFKAIENANMEIGFETIPRLSLRYLSDFKMEMDMALKNNVFENMRFQVLPNSKEKRILSDMTFEQNDYEIMNGNFQQKELYKALLGTEGFAKCFITAEYQYQVFKQGQSFDYTSVVCGYLKAIEQLLYKLMQIRLNFHGNEELWIKCKSLKKNQRAKLVDVIRLNPDPKANSTQILFMKANEKYFDITLNPLIWFLHDDVNGWNVSSSARETIHVFLRNFADECRNDHFHKDNIEVYDEVTSIRNNTFFIVYLLLGGYKLTGNDLRDVEELGICDDSFDRMYKKIQELPAGMKKFVIYFDNQEAIKAYRCYEQSRTIYDESGSVSLSEIKFVAVDEFNSNAYDKAMQGEYHMREITLRKNCMPSKISYINGRNQEVFIEW